MGINLHVFSGSVGFLRETFFEWFPTVSLDIIMKVWWLEMQVIEPISTPTEWIHRLKRVKTDLFWENYENGEKKIYYQRKFQWDEWRKRLPRGKTKTLSSCKYGTENVFLSFFQNGKRLFIGKYRILSLSGQFTLPEHDFGFMNREKLTTEKF